MKQQQTILVLVIICVILLVGIYVGAWYGYQQLQAYKQQYLGDNSTGAKALGFFKTIFG